MTHTRTLTGTPVHGPVMGDPLPHRGTPVQAAARTPKAKEANPMPTATTAASPEALIAGAQRTGRITTDQATRLRNNYSHSTTTEVVRALETIAPAHAAVVQAAAADVDQQLREARAQNKIGTADAAKYARGYAGRPAALRKTLAGITAVFPPGYVRPGEAVHAAADSTTPVDDGRLLTATERKRAIELGLLPGTNSAVHAAGTPLPGSDAGHRSPFSGSLGSALPQAPAASATTRGITIDDLDRAEEAALASISGPPHDGPAGFLTQGERAKLRERLGGRKAR